MSVRYRNSSGNEVIVSGLTPGGELAYGTSTTRSGTIAIPSTAGGADASINIAFTDEMPSTDYKTILQATAYFTIGRVSNKTVNGFTVTIRNTTDSSKSGNLDWYAFELYDIEHAQENAEDIAAIKQAIPTDAGSANKLVTNSQLTSTVNTISDKVDTIEDLVPVTASINNQLVTSNDVARDAAPTAGSTKLVESGGVKTALDAKQDTLTFDNTPTAGSSNPVTSDGVYTATNGAYKTEDTYENTIENNDYFPMYDASVSAPRKTLWSNIISKLDNRYALKQSGTAGYGVLKDASFGGNQGYFKITYPQASSSNRYNMKTFDMTLMNGYSNETGVYHIILHNYTGINSSTPSIETYAGGRIVIIGNKRSDNKTFGVYWQNGTLFIGPVTGYSVLSLNHVLVADSARTVSGYVDQMTLTTVADLPSGVTSLSDTMKWITV